MLIGNYSVLAKDPGRSIGGGSIGLGNNRSDFNKSSQARGVFTNDEWEPKSGVPDGYRHPYAWVLPIKDGALSARNNITGEGNILDLNLAGGVNGEATLSGSGTLLGTGALIISMVASLTGSGTITNAEAKAFLQLSATLAGAGDITGAATALGNASASLSGSGTANGLATALGELAANITVSGDLLTSANVANLVWSFLIESGMTAQEAMVVLLNASPGSVPTAEEIADEVETRTLDSNIVKVTGITVTGVGTPDNPWGPS